MGYMNYHRRSLRDEINKSKGNHPARDSRAHYQFHDAANRLHKELPEKYDVTREMDVLRQSYSQMPTPDETTGLGRAQAQGIERQRKKMFGLMDEIRDQIEGDEGREMWDDR